jgi:hypothetical protein
LARILAVCACAALPACGETVSITIELSYSQDQCGNVPVRQKFIETAGTATVHVLEPIVDSVELPIIAEACFEFAAEPFRSLEALPALLSERVDLDDLPLGEIVDVQVAVYEGGFPSCEPFNNAAPIKVPIVAGRSGEVTLSDSNNTVVVPLLCHGPTDNP